MTGCTSQRQRADGGRYSAGRGRHTGYADLETSRTDATITLSGFMDVESGDNYESRLELRKSSYVTRLLELTGLQGQFDTAS